MIVKSSTPAFDHRSPTVWLAMLCVCGMFAAGCTSPEPEKTPEAKSVQSTSVQTADPSEQIASRGDGPERKTDEVVAIDSPEKPRELAPPAVQTPPVDPQQETQLASQALIDEDFETAYQHARNAYRASPDDPAVMFVMARVLGQRQRFPEAIRMLDRVAERDSNATLPALGQSAQWLILDGQWDEAETRLKKILEFVPEAAMVERELASLYLRQGRRVEAIEYIQRLTRNGELSASYLRSMIRIAFELDGESSGRFGEPIGRLGVAKALAGQQGIEAALNILEGPVRHRLQLPEREAAFRGRLLAYLGRTDALDEWAKHWDETHGGSAVKSQLTDAWIGLGHWHAGQGRNEQAIRLLARVILSDPTDAEAYAKLAELTQDSDKEISSALLKRSEAIKQTRALAKAVTAGGSDHVDIQSIDALSQQLRSLRRVDEAIAWQGLKIAYDPSLDDPQRQAAMSEINRERMEYLRSGSSADAAFVLCGLAPPPEDTTLDAGD